MMDKIYLVNFYCLVCEQLLLNLTTVAIHAQPNYTILSQSSLYTDH